MATPDFFSKLVSGIKKLGKGARAYTRTYNPTSQDGLISVPTGRDHLVDLLTNRQSQTSRQLLETLFRTDPDVSAAVGGYLTLADTPVTILVESPEGEIDEAATAEVQKIIRALTNPTDYTEGFIFKRDLRSIFQELRTMVLLRGGIGGELVMDKMMIPRRIQHVDMADIEWLENENGEYKPRQNVQSSGEKIDLNIPNFFVAFHRRLPTTIYPESDFVSAINSIAARQQVINDLYRIMRLTGFPRISIKIIEEVLQKNAPANAKEDPTVMKTWLVEQRNAIAGQFGDLRADQAFVHFDSSEISVFNDKKPGATMDITAVMETLNAQNQAALKTMATIIGRGNAGVNTASVESRIAAMNADQLNVPVADFMQRLLTFALNIYGIAGFVRVKFAPAELRPNLELEPQRVMMATRLRTDLSLGLITDLEYHLQMHGRLPPAGSPQLSGTNFEAPAPQADVDSVSPNGDPLGRSVASPGSKSARSNNGMVFSVAI